MPTLKEALEQRAACSARLTSSSLAVAVVTPDVRYAARLIDNAVARSRESRRQAGEEAAPEA